MLFDVLETLADMGTIAPKLASSPAIPSRFNWQIRFHFSVIPDNANRSETDAIEMATRFCESHGVDSTLVIPGDIPLIQ